MIFIFIYLFLNIALAFIASLLFENKFLKIASFFLIFTLLSAFWFRIPGSPEIAPIISILFLESTLLQERGYMRIIRPLSALMLFSLVIAFLVWFFKIKRK